MADIANLLTISQFCAKINGAMKPERILELCQCKMMPYYDVDGEFRLAYSEAKTWLNNNLVVQSKSVKLPEVIRVTDIVVKDTPSEIPNELKDLSKHLQHLPMHSVTYANVSGVYFLCKDNKVVYIGQSVNVSQRVGNHISCKEFDYVYYVRCPKTELNYLEAKLIEAIKPKYNFDKKGRLIRPIIRETVDTMELDAAIETLIIGNRL
jgi:predicted GIY-YIG superfamily endonuclease